MEYFSDDYAPIEKSECILVEGEHLHRLYVIRNLPTLIKKDVSKYCQEILPQIQAVLKMKEVSLHAEAAASFLEIFNLKIIAYQNYLSAFIPSILSYIEEADEKICHIWVKFFLKLFEDLPRELLHLSIYKFIVKMTTMDKPVVRIGAIQLLGGLALRFEESNVTKDIFPLCMKLGKDSSGNVRTCYWKNIHIFADRVREDVLNGIIVPSIRDAVTTETDSIRCEAVTSLIKILPNISTTAQRSIVLPLIFSTWEKCKLARDETFIRLLTDFPKVCSGLKAVVTPSNRLELLDIYCEMAGADGLSLRNKARSSANQLGAQATIQRRQLCAENLPAMISFGCSEFFRRKLLALLTSLGVDKSPLVRKAIASKLHLITENLGDSAKVGKRVFMDLLKDFNLDVLSSLIPTIAEIVDHMNSSGIFTSDQDKLRLDLAKGIFSTVDTLHNSLEWKLFAELCTQVHCMVKLVPSDHIFRNYVPKMFTIILTSHIRPVRLAASRTLLIFLRYNLNPEQRQKIISRLENEFCKAHSCYNRLTYLHLCEIACILFSKEYFVVHFLKPMLTMKSDADVNVRIMLAQHLAIVRPMVVEDETLTALVDSTWSNMMENDTATDVIDALQKTKAEIDANVYQVNALLNAKKLQEERQIAAISKNTIAWKTENQEITSLGDTTSLRVRNRLSQTSSRNSGSFPKAGHSR